MSFTKGIQSFESKSQLLPTDEPRGVTPDQSAFAKGKKSKTPALFKNNPGESSVVYKNDAPYFQKLDGKVTDLDAVKNYGMKNFTQVMNDAEEFGFPLPEKMSKKQFQDWWKSKAGDGLSFTIKDVKDNDILLNADPKGKSVSFTKEHLLKRDHFDYAHIIEAVLKQPNEAWSWIDKTQKVPSLTHSYLKYFKGDNEHKIFVLIAREDGAHLRVVTSYFLNDADFNIREKTFNNIRKGSLLNAIKRF